MNETVNRYNKRILVFVPFLIIGLIILQFVSITRFNSHSYTVQGADEKSPSYLDLDIRKDTTSSWLKRDFSWKGETLDLSAQTIDGVFYNNSDSPVNQWSLRIDIKDDCFVNNAWCGIMEIHQFVGTEKEAVQTINLRDYDLDQIALDHFYDGDLLIPLQKGDYILYTPSEKDSEMPIPANTTITMGVIFYYFDSLDFYDYQIEYTYHRPFTYGALYLIILVLILIYVVALIIYIISLQFYKDAQKQLELKKSGLLSMSDIYILIYMIDLNKNELIPVVENEDSTLKRKKGLEAGEQLAELIREDATEEYQALALDFCNVSTLAKRMDNKNSIVLEYLSRHLGWCSIRFFTLDRIEGMPTDRVLFTIQVIDSEKKEMKAIEERITLAQQENQMNGVFLRGLSDEILGPAEEMLSYNEKILVESRDEAITDCARSVRRSGRKLTGILHDLLDYSRIETEQLKAEEAPLSMKSLCGKVRDFAAGIVDGNKPVEMKYDFAPTVPERIISDEKLLLRVLNLLIVLADDHTREGSITFSVFGKEYESGVHLVFSVRDTGDTADAGNGEHIGIRLAERLLELVHSELSIIHTPGSGSEVFFELETVSEGTVTLGDTGFELS